DRAPRGRARSGELARARRRDVRDPRALPDVCGGDCAGADPARDLWRLGSKGRRRRQRARRARPTPPQPPPHRPGRVAGRGMRGALAGVLRAAALTPATHRRGPDAQLGPGQSPLPWATTGDQIPYAPIWYLAVDTDVSGSRLARKLDTSGSSCPCRISAVSARATIGPRVMPLCMMAS